MADIPESYSNDGSPYDTSSQGAAASYFQSYPVDDTNPSGRFSGEVTPIDAYGDDYSGSGLRLVSQEGVYQLTQDLRNFSDTLTSLKAVFCEERESLDQSLRVVAYERLGELLKVLKSTVNKYEELDSTGILNAAENLINHIKNFNYECGRETVPPEIFAAINNLALAFSSSVSECLIGDINISPTHSLEIQSQGFKSLESEQTSLTSQRTYLDDGSQEGLLSPSYVEGGDSRSSIHRAGSTTSVHESVAKSLEGAFDRAKTWSKYANDLLTFIKKRSHIELEYANKLAKLSQTTKAMLSGQSFLPFQSLYFTLFDNDKEYASSLNAMYQNHLLTQKYFDPLNATRQEHDRIRKVLREAWRKEKRRLEEAESNLRKAKQNYHTRNMEYQKAKDAKLKADQQLSDKTSGEGSHSRQASGNSNQLAPAGTTLGLIGSGISKIEKKRKHEDDSYNKAVLAEQYYRTCVHDTEQRRRDLERKEEELLEQLRNLLTVSDQTTKRVTLNFFHAYCDLTSPIKIQYQALLDESKSYEPGFQYAEYLRHLVPEQCDVGQDSQASAYPTYADGFEQTTGGVGTDTESSSSRSMGDLSPAPSPAIPTNRKIPNIRRASTEGSLSSEEILEEGKETGDQSRNKVSSIKDVSTASFPESPSPANARPQFPQVMKMMEHVKGAFKKKMPKATVFGVHFSVAAQDAVDGIPMLIKRCVAEIDNRGIAVKGIYRVNGVKNRIEKICSLLDSPQCARADLSEQSPHDISGVLKFFLRQLPEPLVPHDFYEHFIEVAKEYNEVTKAHRLTNSKGDKTEEEMAEGLYQTLQPCLQKMRTNVEMLPAANNKTLYFIIAHLSRVAQHHSENKMTASNLAIIFGPTLLRPKPSNESGNELLPLLELPNLSQAIDMLVTYHRDLFLMPPQRIESEDLKQRLPVTQPLPGEVVLSSESDDFRELYARSKSSPYRSSEFLSTEQSSPEVAPTDIDTTLTSDSQRIASSRSSLTSNNDAISPRQEAYLEGNPRMDINSDVSLVTNERRTIIPHCASLTKIPSTYQSTEGLMRKEVGAVGKSTQESDGKHNFYDDSQRVKNLDSTYHNIRRPSLKNLPFFRASFDSGSRGSDESEASLCRTSEMQTNKAIQRSMSVDTTFDNTVSSHRPRSQRIVLPAFSARQRNRKAAQTDPIDPVAISEQKTMEKDFSNDDRSPDHPNHNNRPTSSKSVINQRTLPGRTPPMNKTVSLSLARENFRTHYADDGQKRDGAEIPAKLRLDLGESADDSFC